eukprot:292963-Chlamydomonas_euryale.AAC.1
MLRGRQGAHVRNGRRDLGHGLGRGGEDPVCRHGQPGGHRRGRALAARRRVRHPSHAAQGCGRGARGVRQGRQSTVDPRVARPARAQLLA